MKRILIGTALAVATFTIISFFDRGSATAGTAFYTTGQSGAAGGTGFADGGVIGTGVNTEVAYWNSAHTITGSPNFTFDGGAFTVGNELIDINDGIMAINPARVAAGAHAKSGSGQRIVMRYITATPNRGEISVDDNVTATGDLHLEVQAVNTGVSGPHIRLQGDPSNVVTTWLDAYDGAVATAGNLLPFGGDATGSVGTNAVRWNLLRAVTVTSGDIGFDDGKCAICGRPFEVDDDIVLHVHKTEIPKEGKPYVLTVPIHANCRGAASAGSDSAWKKACRGIGLCN